MTNLAAALGTPCSICGKLRPRQGEIVLLPLWTCPPCLRQYLQEHTVSGRTTETFAAIGRKLGLTKQWVHHNADALGIRPKPLSVFVRACQQCGDMREVESARHARRKRCASCAAANQAVRARVILLSRAITALCSVCGTTIHLAGPSRKVYLAYHKKHPDAATLCKDCRGYTAPSRRGLIPRLDGEQQGVDHAEQANA